MATDREMTALIREIRTSFNRLKSVAEALHGDLDINPSMRAVLEALILESPQTVPAIAARKGVSRQHVQKIMNTLLEKDFVVAEANPDHKRSDLFRPSAKGKSVFSEIASREAKPLARMARALSSEEVGVATRLLVQMNELIETSTRNGVRNEASE